MNCAWGQKMNYKCIVKIILKKHVAWGKMGVQDETVHKFVLGAWK